MTEQNLHPETENPFFVGRQALYARLHQHILDPLDRHALLFTGHHGMGKTSLLRHFPQFFPDPFYGVYIDLAQADLRTEAAWLNYLVDVTNRMLAEHEFSLSRLPQLELDSHLTWQEWFREVYLEAVFHILRSRRLIWLMDDAQYLLENLPHEHLIYLHRLLAQFEQLTIVLTLDTDYDSRITALSPLVSLPNAERIQRLSPEASSALIRQFAPTASEESLKKIYELTGGHPQFLQAFGTELQSTWVSTNPSEAVQKASPVVYAQAQGDFKRIWQTLSHDERLVLTAIASLLYANPLQAVSAKRIETWLIETDYPLDLVAINAALRGLDYRDIVQQQRDSEIRLITGLLQSWLVQNARLEETSDSPLSRRTWWLIVLGVILLISLISLVALVPKERLAPSLPNPTITLNP